MEEIIKKFGEMYLDPKNINPDKKYILDLIKNSPRDNKISKSCLEILEEMYLENKYQNELKIINWQKYGIVPGMDGELVFNKKCFKPHKIDYELPSDLKLFYEIYPCGIEWHDQSQSEVSFPPIIPSSRDYVNGFVKPKEICYVLQKIPKNVYHTGPSSLFSLPIDPDEWIIIYQYHLVDLPDLLIVSNCNSKSNNFGKIGFVQEGYESEFFVIPWMRFGDFLKILTKEKFSLSVTLHDYFHRFVMNSQYAIDYLSDEIKDLKKSIELSQFLEDMENTVMNQDTRMIEKLLQIRKLYEDHIEFMPNGEGFNMAKEEFAKLSV